MSRDGMFSFKFYLTFKHHVTMEMDESFSKFEAVMKKEPIQNLNKTVGYLQYTQKVAHLCIIEKNSLSFFFKS